MTPTPTQVSGVCEGNHNDRSYDQFLDSMTERLLRNINNGSEPLFTTNAPNLWEKYLNSFQDPTERQYHNCHACRHFIERFGHLVTIEANGGIASAIWCADDAPPAYKDAIRALEYGVRGTKITGVFLSSESVWGTPVTGVWTHLSVRPPASIRHRCATQTAGQRMAEKREDFLTVGTALREFSRKHLETALKLLKTDSLYRSEKVLGQAEWLHKLHVDVDSARGIGKTNLVWKAIATAPAGFCHPRSSMIGTLLEDIAAGKDFNEVSKAFAAKMHPLSYQRPQAAPSAGAIAAAEKIFEQLNAAGSLARRFARLDEVQALWRPFPVKSEKSTDGLFGHLQTKSEDRDKAVDMRVPAQTMTWVKFQETALPTAARIELLAPRAGSYSPLVTAVNADAPPILQWDQEDRRNPVSWYFWHGGSSASSFGLAGGSFVEVEAVALKPSMWNEGYEHHGAGVMFVLKGAHETKDGGAGLFPEMLKAELHGIRSVLESYSRGARIEGLDEPHAAGIMLTKSSSGWATTRLRVYSSGGTMEYKLDRWD